MICEHFQGQWPRSEKGWQRYAQHCKDFHSNGFAATAQMQISQLAGSTADAQICTPEEPPLTPEEEEMRLF
jgi:hypothetical protein